jgi:crotonobetainyl-CoA:carnitine CoA-transferase CaiB-like acyl-CoA transferase
LTLALEGIRILDLTFVWAGPTATMLLADLGAEVIKIESYSRWDSRGALPAANEDGSPRRWEGRGGFHTRNRNKLGITLDLSQEPGRDVFLRLVAISDVVVENYSLRVMPNWGLDYESLKRVKEDIIVVSMPGFGASGPYKDQLSWGETLDATSGISSRTGYRDGPPMRSAVAFGDPVGGFHGALAAIAALNQRKQTGKGQQVVLSQHEALVRFLGPEILAAAFGGKVPARMGDRHPLRAPQGAYRCKGDDAWVAISVGSDEEWVGLCDALGDADLRGDSRLQTLAGRQEHHDELDERIQAWTTHLSSEEVVERLRDRNVTASPVNKADEVLGDEQLAARKFFAPIMESEGTYLHPGAAAQLTATPSIIRQPAPAFGEHNDYVFRELLGLTEDRILELKATKVIADEPPLPEQAQGRAIRPDLRRQT